MENAIKAIYLADLDYFQSKLESSPEPTIFLPVAAIYSRLGKYEEVLSVCTKGLEVNAGHTQLQVLLAEAMAQTGRKDEARELLFDILVSDEDNYKALKLMGQIFKSDEHKEEAVKYLRAAYMKAPEDDELVVALEEMGENVNKNMQSVSPESSDDDFEVEDNDASSNFNIQTHISNAEAVISDLLQDMFGQKSADAAPGTADTAETAGPAQSAGSAQFAGPDLSAGPVQALQSFLNEPELTDDEILQALKNLAQPLKAETDKEAVDNPDIQEDSLADMLNNLPQDLDALISGTGLDLAAPQENSEGFPSMPEPQFHSEDAFTFEPAAPDLPFPFPEDDLISLQNEAAEFVGEQGESVPFPDSFADSNNANDINEEIFLSSLLDLQTVLNEGAKTDNLSQPPAPADGGIQNTAELPGNSSLSDLQAVLNESAKTEGDIFSLLPAPEEEVMQNAEELPEDFLTLDLQAILNESAKTEGEIFSQPLPAPEEEVIQNTAELPENFLTLDSQAVLNEGAKTEGDIFSLPPAPEGSVMQNAEELPENAETLLPEELMGKLQKAVPSQSFSEEGDIVELDHDDTLLDFKWEDEFVNTEDDTHDGKENKEDLFVPEPVIPVDLAESVFKASGMDDGGAGDERITPESIKKGRAGEEKK